MALDQVLLLCRRLTAPGEYLRQSVIGIAVPGKTVLISPSDLNSCTPTAIGTEEDRFGNTALLEAFTVFAGSFLDMVFPTSPEFQIFRLHYDRFETYREQALYGTKIRQWDDNSTFCYLGIEYLAGNPYADLEGLARHFQYGGRTDSFIQRLPLPVSLTAAQLKFAGVDFLPHPGMLPADIGEVGIYMYEVERQQRNTVAKVM
jgi:hypothetical protein